MAAHDDSYWLSPSRELIDRLTQDHDLKGDSSALLRYAAEQIDVFYKTRQTLTHRGDVMPVSASPIPQQAGRLLMKIAVREQVKRTLEIGFSFGMSTCHLLMAHEVTGGTKHIAIDPFQQSEFYKGAGLVNVIRFGLSARFLWLEEPSNLALPRLLATDQRFDLCFIDGSHIFGDIFIDAYYCHRMLREGGMLILDDAWLPATRTVKNILVTNFGMEEEPTPDVPNFAVMRKVGAGLLDWKDFAAQWKPFEVG